MSEIHFNALVLVMAVLRVMLVRGRKSVVVKVQWC